MLEPSHNNELPTIPGKRYFTIGEVAELCAVKAHVLRYWEQEFPQLSPVKRRGNRRYYQRADVITIRQIRSLLYDQGYTILIRYRLQWKQVFSAHFPHSSSTYRVQSNGFVIYSSKALLNRTGKSPLSPSSNPVNSSFSSSNFFGEKQSRMS